MWDPELCDSGPGWEKYAVRQDHGALSFGEVLTLWQSVTAFQQRFSHWLCQSTFKAIYFECRPVTLRNIDEPFEYVIADAALLVGRQEEPAVFARYFDGNPAVWFANLGGDAELIVPCPQAGDGHYGHLAAFLRTTEDGQKRALWQMVGERAHALLGDAPLWISTSGLGVAWLHVRMDGFPKYYTHEPYRLV